MFSADEILPNQSTTSKRYWPGVGPMITSKRHLQFSNVFWCSQKRCKSLPRVDPMQSQRTDANRYDRRTFTPGAAFAVYCTFRIFASTWLWKKFAQRRIVKANQRWDAPRLVYLTGCCCSYDAGSGSYSEVIGESHRAVWAWCYL